MNDLNKISRIPIQDLVIRTDFKRSEKLTRIPKRKSVVVLSQASQVHEFVIQLLLSRGYKIKGLNFVVKDTVRIIVEFQIQTFWWDIDRYRWKARCLEMSRLVSSLMPIGLCIIKPI